MESALLLPVLLTVLLGIVEVGMLIQTQVGAAAAVRAAVRSGTAASASADDPLAVAQAALTGGLGVTPQEIDEIWVYRPDLQDGVGPVGAQQRECVDDCVRVTLDSTGNPQWAAGNWSTIDQECSGSGTHLGVRIYITRDNVTAGIGLPQRVSANAVMRYEPRSGSRC